MDILSEIIAHKKKEVEERKKHRSFDDVYRSVESGTFEARSLKTALENSSVGIISEFKRRSPSKGWINEHADAVTVVKGYETNGAAALSVLTDEAFFGGTTEDLKRAAESVRIPVLRKEFIVDEYQIYEAKLLGASAILLIAAAITPQECRRFTERARDLQLDVLLELHDEKEIDYITPLHSLIGINNRNLGTFVTDAGKSFRVAALLPKEAVWVSESGISSPEIVNDLRDAGYRGFLIGENFMKTADPGAALGEFVKGIGR